MDTQCIIPEEAIREFRRLECDLESCFPGRIIVWGLAISYLGQSLDGLCQIMRPGTLLSGPH